MGISAPIHLDNQTLNILIIIHHSSSDSCLVLVHVISVQKVVQTLSASQRLQHFEAINAHVFLSVLLTAELADELIASLVFTLLGVVMNVLAGIRVALL